MKVLKPFNQYTLSDVSPSVSIDHAIAECERELAVRQRIYDQWCSQGKIARVDAEDRLCRLLIAVSYLVRLRDCPGAVEFLVAATAEDSGENNVDVAAQA